MLTTGVVGSGQAAAHYIRCYEQLPTAEVVGVVPSVVGGETEPTDAEGYSRYESLNALLEQEDVDIVDVCAPDFPRDRLIEGIAGEEIAVLVPHPFEIDVPGLRDLAGELTVGGGTVLVKQPYRHHPAFQRIRTAIRDNEIGAFGVARISRRIPYRTAHEGVAASSVLTNPGAIYFDCLGWLGGEIEQVYARRTEFGDDREEVSNALVRFASGATAHLELALHAHADEQEFIEVRGTDGGIEFENTVDHGLAFATDGDAATDLGPPIAGPPERSSDPSYRELGAIVAHLREEDDGPGAAVLTPAEAEASLEAVGAALRSAEDNVPVPTEAIPA